MKIDYNEMSPSGRRMLHNQIRKDVESGNGQPGQERQGREVERAMEDKGEAFEAIDFRKPPPTSTEEDYGL